MITRNLIKPNRYQDAVTLMQVAERVRTRHSVTQIFCHDPDGHLVELHTLPPG